jgi:hypothetical protein
MAQLILPEDLARRLNKIAQKEKRSIAEVLTSLLDRYTVTQENADTDPLAAMDGLFDDDISDLSTTVRETNKF